MKDALDERFCRVCLRQHKAVPAVAILETPTLKDWYLCRNHSDVVARSMVGLVYKFHLLSTGEQIQLEQLKEG